MTEPQRDFVGYGERPPANGIQQQAAVKPSLCGVLPDDVFVHFGIWFGKMV